MEANWEPPVTERAEVVAVVKVAFEADRDPSNVPPWTVSPVVVAFPAVMFPKAERLVTFREPKDAPPVTDKEVVVAAPAEREPSDVPPLTVSPVVGALAKLLLPVTPREPKEVPPVTESPVVVALPKILTLPEMLAA